MSSADQKLNLLSLDGGGIRILSSLYILKEAMKAVNRDCPPKPCDYFDIIGGVDSGGLAAIMLGRLRMDVDQCINVYQSLSDQMLSSDSRLGAMLKTMSRSSNGSKLDAILGNLLRQQGCNEKMLLKDPGNPCKVFTCLTSEEGKAVNLTSYPSKLCPSELYNSATIWETSRASLVSSFGTKLVGIESAGQAFCDSSVGSNNPIRRLWVEAINAWPSAPLKAQLGCLVSIGTGQTSIQRFNANVPGIISTLQHIACQTEATANMFLREHKDLDDENRYFRFSVPNGLAEISPNDVNQVRTVINTTQDYVSQEHVCKQMNICAESLRIRGKNNSHSLPSMNSAWELPGAMRRQTGLFGSKKPSVAV